MTNAKFNSKTAVWIPYAETGYTQGEKMGTKDGKIEVKRLVDGKVKLFKEEEVDPINPPKSSIDSWIS